jgi:AraC-like DNA-binding protein
MSVSDIAKYVHLSVSRFKHLFKTETGTTPKRMLRRMQVERAGEMLRAGHEQVKWIAAEVGMPVSATFVRNFSRDCGCTPGEYRRRSRAGLAFDGSGSASAEVAVEEQKEGVFV